MGASGLVGSSYLRENPATVPVPRDELYGSRSVIRCNRLVVAAPSAQKWRANSRAEEDLRDVERLGKAIRQRFRPREMLVFSTIDVYPASFGGNEECESQTTDPYGRNRKWLADFLSEQLSPTTVVRLPGLFGPGLKKNQLFDIVENRQEFIARLNPLSEYQWLPIDWAIRKSEDYMSGKSATVNLVSEPCALGDLDIGDSSWQELMSLSNPITQYKVRTVHDRSGFLIGRHQVSAMVRGWAENWTREKNLG